MPDDPQEKSPLTVQVKLPTEEDRREVQRKVERCAPHWKSSPALLIIKPEIGAIVSVNNIEYDETYFTLHVSVRQALVAPDAFDAAKTLTLQCVWNQPYISLFPGSLNAPYCFYLDFGLEGVQRVQKFCATKLFQDLSSMRGDPALLGILSSVFAGHRPWIELSEKESAG